MGKRKTFGEDIGSGKACILVREKGLGDSGHPFWKWLLDEGFHLWHNHGNFGMDWVFVNLNSMIVAPGMPGIKVTTTIREHAITAEEFKTIWGIFMRYEGLAPLDMPEKAGVKLITRGEDGNPVIREDVTKAEMDRIMLRREVIPTKENLKKQVLAGYLENPHWAEYYNTAPSDLCRELIALEFMYSEFESDRLVRDMEEIEKRLGLADWQHLYRYCDNNPRRKVIHDRIRELGGEEW